MESFAIRLLECEENICCPMCGVTSPARSGLGLFAADQDQPVCRSCGKKVAPAMIALLDLAQTAERVSRGCRHLLTPPMESLLDLARAAEDFSSTARSARA